MTDDRRNPYVILGLSHGADLADAQRAFERRSREARWGDQDITDLANLTWAVEQIELYRTDPTAALGTYRVPADPSVLEPPSSFGLLRPAPRPATRATTSTPPEEREVIFDAARLDAAQHLLDRTAHSVGRRLDQLVESPVPSITVPIPPVRRRGWWPVAAVTLVAIAVVIIAGARSLLDDTAPLTNAPEATADSTGSNDSSPPTPPSALAPTTAARAPMPGLGDAVTVDGITITPDEPLDAYGHLCLLFTVDGDVPLGFVRDRVDIISGGRTIAAALDINTGRAEITDVYGEPAPAVREICFPVDGWRDEITDLVYVTEGGNYRWTIADPTGSG